MLREYVVLDLEMTGLSPLQDRILEIGAVKVKDHKIVDEFHTLINPHRRLEEKIVELTGITDEMAESGAELEVVLKDFLAFLSDHVIVGHSLMSDYSFLKQNATNQKLPLACQGIDTLKIARKVLPVEVPKNLIALCEYLKIGQEEQHRALEDAKATAKVLEKLQEKYEETFPGLFVPKQLQYKARKLTPITKQQKNDLKQLLEYHRIDMRIDLESLTRSEASRWIDKIILKHGRMKDGI